MKMYLSIYAYITICIYVHVCTYTIVTFADALFYAAAALRMCPVALSEPMLWSLSKSSVFLNKSRKDSSGKSLVKSCKCRFEWENHQNKKVFMGKSNVNGGLSGTVEHHLYMEVYSAEKTSTSLKHVGKWTRNWILCRSAIFLGQVQRFWSNIHLDTEKHHPNPRSGWGHRGVTREGVPSGGSTGRSWNFSRNICSNVWIRGTVPPSCLGFGWWIAGVDPAGSGFWATHWGKPQWFDLGSDMSSELWRICWEWLCRRLSPFFSVLLSQNDWCR